jgi:hypothetical protein
VVALFGVTIMVGGAVVDDHLFGRGVEQIDPHCGSRMHTEQQDQHWCHQRAPAHTGLPNQ